MTSKNYFAQPVGIKQYHIFGTDNKSLCGKVAILKPNPDLCESITGNEVYQPKQDCKSCCKKQGILIQEKYK